MSMQFSAHEAEPAAKKLTSRRLAHRRCSFAARGDRRMTTLLGRARAVQRVLKPRSGAPARVTGESARPRGSYRLRDRSRHSQGTQIKVKPNAGWQAIAAHDPAFANPDEPSFSEGTRRLHRPQQHADISIDRRQMSARTVASSTSSQRCSSVRSESSTILSRSWSPGRPTKLRMTSSLA